MQAYLDDPQLKEDFVKEIARHREADQIVQGTYGEGVGKNWKGCAVGCSVHSLNKIKKTKYQTSNHKIYETALGIPEWLARLEDTIFEGLPKEEAMKWPERFAAAIPVGANLDPIKWRFSAFVLSSNIERVLTLEISDELKKQVVDSIRGVLTLHETAIKTGEWSESAAWSAESAARSAESAAWSAAESARSAAWSAESAARFAARSAAWSAWSAESAAWFAARSAAWSAAESAARSAAWSAAGSAEHQKFATKLIELLEKA